MKKGIIAIIIGTMCVFHTNVAKAQIPTVDFGNIAGTIGIVTQGITNVQQGVDSIKNASNFLAIVGDSVGTITKFADKIKGYVQDAQAAIEKAKQRISEGMALYNKYKGEIEERKEKYQALLASIPNYMNPNSYDDSANSSQKQSTSAGSSASYNNSANFSSSNNKVATNSTASLKNNSSSISKTTATASKSAVAQAPSMKEVSNYNKAGTQNQVATTASSKNNLATTASSKNNVATKIPANNVAVNNLGVSKSDTVKSNAIKSDAVKSNAIKSDVIKSDAVKSNVIKNDKILIEDGKLNTEEEFFLFEEIEENSIENDSAKKLEKEEVSSIDIGRKAFSSPVSDKETAKDVASKDVSKAINSSVLTKAAEESASKVTIPTVSKAVEESASKATTPTVSKAVEEATSKATTPTVSKAVEEPTSKTTTPATTSAPATFRQSPTATQKQSKTLYYSSHFDFAAETNNSTKGSGYDKNGIFIFDVKYCDKSVEDMMTEAGTRECLVKIVNKINDENAHFAIENKADCEKMVFETAVALLAEALNMLKEASNYQDTLDEQGNLGGNSNNTRDDTQVLAMSYEQTQLLLNRLTLLLSGETIINVTKDICGASKNVLEENEVETSSGGK